MERSRKNSLNTLHPGGSLSYGEAYRNATPEEIEKKITSYLSVPLYSLEKEGEVSQFYLAEFDSWTEQLIDQNIAITWFLSPYHPKVYEEIRENYAMVLEVESLLVQRSKEKGIHIVGSCDPEKAGVIADHFYDAMHLKEEGIQTLFPTLL